MTQEPSKVQDIFNRVIELESKVDRSKYLDVACAGDIELRSKVQALLDAYREAGSFLESPPPGIPPQPSALDVTTDQLIREGPGTVIGPYKLLQQIGEGGMGVVYMAEQTHPVKRRVALKIIKPGMDSRQVIARFEAERQALAMMDHLNIAKALDAGATETGRPYFVMELVHGVPITKYCDDNHLSPTERLGLFVPVCQAIQHAHQKGIIHRDIKPTNVLVCLYDGNPVAKVIDFGVAKAVEQRLTERTLFTQFGNIIGTFEYMSPEQAEMSQLGIDTRSDVYSLGVLLYELLTGTTPLDKRRLRTVALDEMLRLIREEEPPKPSTRISQSDQSQRSSAARRNTEASKLARLVRGDLDWIVMKCLEKDRSRRYETATDLARDVQRFLVDDAIEARPPSALYRLSKFARRNRMRLSIITLTLSVVALALFAVISTRNSRRESQRLAVEHQQTLAAEQQANRLALREEKKTLAKERILQGDFVGGETAVQDAISLGAEPDWVDFRRAQISYHNGPDGEGLETLERGSQDLLPNSAARSLLALHYMAAGEYEKTFPIVESINPDQLLDTEQLLYGGCALGHSNPRIGLELLDKAIDRLPSLLAFIARSQSLAQESLFRSSIGHAERAIQDASAARTIRPRNPEAIYSSLVANMAAYALQQSGDLEKRDQALQRMRSDIEAMTGLGEKTAIQFEIDVWLDYVGDEERVFEFWRKLYESKMITPNATANYAVALYRSGDLRKSLEVAEYHRDHNHAGESLMAFLLMEFPERRDEATRIANEGLQDKPAYIRWWSSCTFLALGDQATSRKLAQESLDAFKNVPPLVREFLVERFRLCVEYLASPTEESERKLLDHTQSHKYVEPVAHYCIACFSLANGNRTKAKSHFRKAVDSKVMFLEPYQLSRVFLARMEADIHWPNWLP